MKDADTLRGLPSWIREAFPEQTDQDAATKEKAKGVGSQSKKSIRQNRSFGSMLWVEGLALACEQSYEEAILTFYACLSDETCVVAWHELGRPFVQERILECHAFLADWPGMHEAMVSFSNKRESKASKGRHRRSNSGRPSNFAVGREALADGGDIVGPTQWPMKEAKALATFARIIAEEDNDSAYPDASDLFPSSFVARGDSVRNYFSKPAMVCTASVSILR